MTFLCLISINLFESEEYEDLSFPLRAEIQVPTLSGPFPLACQAGPYGHALFRFELQRAQIITRDSADVVVSCYQVILVRIFRHQLRQQANPKRKFENEASCSELNSKAPMIQLYRPVLKKIHKLVILIKLGYQMRSLLRINCLKYVNRLRNLLCNFP